MAGFLSAEEWREVSNNPSLTIYSRHRSGSSLEELRAVGELDATPVKVDTVLGEVSKFPEFMPYTKESRILATDSQLCYMLPVLRLSESATTPFESRASRATETMEPRLIICTGNSPTRKGRRRVPGSIALISMKGRGSWSQSAIALERPTCFIQTVAVFLPFLLISPTSKALGSCSRRFGRAS
jgi:hypothetical protein